MTRTWAVAVLVGALCAGATRAVEAPAAGAASVLAPAPDAELLARIEALPDNTWMKLPPCKTVGDLGILNKDPDYKRIGPRVRDYCNKLVWAPERARALYCGGGHNIHPWNDVWEYDLASNTWICLYGADPAPPRTVAGKEAEAEDWYKQHAVLKDGVVRTPRGGPLRPCHTWWSLCYDTAEKRLLFLESHKGLFCVDKALLAKTLGLDPKDPLLKTYGSGPGEAWLYAFYPATGEWKEAYANVPKAFESSCMEYLPGTRTIWWNSGQTYLFDAAGKDWKAQPKGGPGAGGESVYDPDTNQVIATAGLSTWVYSCAANTWTLAQKEAPDGGCVPVSTFCYDSTAKKCVLFTGLTVKTKPELTGMRLWLYDVKTNTWTQPEPRGETPKIGNVAGYYDPARNVTVIYSNAETWVYRCKKAAK